jgi:hypothetical protein
MIPEIRKRYRRLWRKEGEDIFYKRDLLQLMSIVTKRFASWLNVTYYARHALIKFLSALLTTLSFRHSIKYYSNNL